MALLAIVIMLSPFFPGDPSLSSGDREIFLPLQEILWKIGRLDSTEYPMKDFMDKDICLPVRERYLEYNLRYGTSPKPTPGG